MSSQIKICYLTRSLRVEAGGLDRYSYEVISRMRQRPEFAVKTLVEQVSGEPDERAMLKDASSSFLALAANVGAIRRQIAECDIIHALDLYPYGLAAALANLGLGKPLFINGVGTWSVARLDHWLYGPLLRWTYRRAQKVLCISRYTREKILQKYPALNNLEVVYLGIDNKKFQRPALGHSSSGQVIIGVGALKRRKGYHMTIAAIAQLIHKYPNLKYYIVGSQSIGGYAEELKRLVSEHALQGVVEFLTGLSDQALIDLCYHADVFVLHSLNVGEHFEGFGLVFLEAAACGLPTVGTTNNGIAEAMDDGESGILVAQGDVAATAAALDRLLSNTALRQRMGEAGRKFAASWDWSRTIAEYLNRYQKAIQSK